MTTTPASTMGTEGDASTDAAPRRSSSRWRGGGPGLQGRDRTVFWLMVAVPTALHVLLVWLPTLASIFFSFTDWKGIRFSDVNLVGFLNYQQIFTVFERDFFQAVLNNLVLLVFLFSGPTLLGMFLAYLLDKEIAGSRVYQSIFYMPVVLSLAVVGFIWQSVMYSTENGLATELFGQGEAVNWLGNQEYLIAFTDNLGISANFVAILVAIAWRHTGYIMVLYLAGLKSVDQSLKESASLDGCNEWQAFRHVIFPTLKPINVVVAVITVIEALRAFDIIFVLNTPRRTQVLSILTTNNLLGEGGGNVGRGSAYAVILFLMCFGFVIWYVTNHYRNSEV